MQRIGFALRLATSLKDHAKLLATRDGVSLNHFISLAVAEKIARLEAETVPKDPPRPLAPALGRDTLFPGAGLGQIGKR
jgi:hypothetical protein